MLLIDFLYFQNSSGSEGAVCCGGILLVIAVIIFVAYSAAKDQAKNLAKAQVRQAEILAEARTAYQDSLTKLKRDPTNSNLRETTLVTLP